VERLQEKLEYLALLGGSSYLRVLETLVDGAIERFEQDQR
jgi:hypothetical protein